MPVMSIGIPVQGTLERDALRAASLAASLRGYQDLYRFVPNQLPLRFRGGVDFAFTSKTSIDSRSP